MAFRDSGDGIAVNSVGAGKHALPPTKYNESNALVAARLLALVQFTVRCDGAR